MKTEHIKITEEKISAYIPLQVSVLRDTQNPLLQLRYHGKRVKASWRIYYKNRWHKVKEWPAVRTREIRANFNVLLNQIIEGKEAKLVTNCFITIGDLLDWYAERMAENANLSLQRKADINSAVNKHLKPMLKDVDILDIDKNTIDKLLVWPLQKVMAKSSVVKKFHMLKAAFKDAFDLDLLPNHPMATMKISDFGDFSEDEKESNLKPRMVPALLDELTEQAPIVQMVCMLMLTLGTRIGETLKAKWSNFNTTFDPCWDIPGKDTKTSKPHTIHLPSDIAQTLIRWKAYLKSIGYSGKFLFPHPINDNESIDYERVRKLIHQFSAGEWRSHDLRKCARQCWEEQGVDGLVAERMLNHTLGRTTRAYTGEAYELRKAALEAHCEWLNKQKENCFLLNLSSTPNSSNILDEAS